jgi:hypothetical protein
MTQEALKLALEGVEIHSPNSPEYIVCAALIEALAQPEQEPVVCCQQYDTCLQPCTPRGKHLAQRTWVGLTNNELQPIADEYRILFGGWVEDFARAIEAKLKEKNT